MRKYITVRFDNEHSLVEVVRTTDLETAISEMKYDFQRILEYKYGDECIDVFQQCEREQYSDDDECGFVVDGEASEAFCYNTNVNGTDYNWMIL